MGDHSLYVRFPDGTVRYGLYQSTADLAFADLVDTFEATQGPGYYANQRRWDDVPAVLAVLGIHQPTEDGSLECQHPVGGWEADADEWPCSTYEAIRDAVR